MNLTRQEEKRGGEFTKETGDDIIDMRVKEDPINKSNTRKEHTQMKIAEFIQQSAREDREARKRARRGEILKYTLHTIVVIAILIALQSTDAEWSLVLVGALLVLITSWFFRHLRFSSLVEDIIRGR